jgi:hypothetical protein
LDAATIEMLEQVVNERVSYYDELRRTQTKGREELRRPGQDSELGYYPF